MGVRRRRSERGTLHHRSEDEATEAPHTITCLLLGVGLAWFYKWRDRALGPAVASGLHTRRDRRRNIIDRAGVAIKMAIATRGGIDAVNQSGWRKDETKRVIFHTDRGLDVHGELVHQAVSPARAPAFDGNGLGRASTTPPRRRSSAAWSRRPSHATSSRTHPPGLGRRPGLVLRVLQLQAPTQRDRHDEPDQLREHHGPRPGSRIKKPSTIRGNHNPYRGGKGAVRWSLMSGVSW